MPGGARRGKRTLKPESLALWRRVRDGGGWWTQDELVAALNLSPEVVCKIRHNLVRLDYLKLRRVRLKEPPRPGQRRVSIVVGVTARCEAPKGETLAPQPLPAEAAAP